MPYEDHNLESMIPFQFARSISNAFGQESIITPTNTLTLDAWFGFGLVLLTLTTHSSGEMLSFYYIYEKSLS